MSHKGAASFLHTAVLLAGGQSKRMGKDKALLLHQGEPLWRHQRDQLAATHPARILVSLAEQQEVSGLQEEIVRDTHPQIGPLGGLAAAFQETTTPFLLVLAVDLPFMTPAFLINMLSTVGKGCGVVPVNGDYYEPLAAVYPVVLAGLVQEFIQQETFRLHDLVEEARQRGWVKPLPVREEERGLFRNLNTPEDI